MERRFGLLGLWKTKSFEHRIIQIPVSRWCLEEQRLTILFLYCEYRLLIPVSFMIVCAVLAETLSPLRKAKAQCRTETQKVLRYPVPIQMMQIWLTVFFRFRWKYKLVEHWFEKVKMH